MIYFDNAATSFPKPREVIRELQKCVSSYLGNPGRSSHKLSVMAAEKIYSVREKISDHLGVTTPEQIVFTYNATHALNLAIKSFVTKDCHVLTSDFEHNSVVRPLERLKLTHNITYSTFGCFGDTRKNLDGVLLPSTRGIIREHTKEITDTHGRFQNVAVFKAHLSDCIVDGANDRRTGVMCV